MSQVYVKRCDRCGRVAVSPNTPQPPGWSCLADNMHGTLASFDLCSDCLEQTGMKAAITQRIRDRAIGELREHLDAHPEQVAAIPVHELEQAVLNGDFDEAFAQGDGIHLADHEIVDAEVVG